MRIFGIVAIFVLAVVAIVEGAALVRLSGRVDAVADGSGAATETASTDTLRRAVAVDRIPVATAPGAPAAVPRLTATASAPAAPAPPGSPSAVLREALETTEGRQHLKAAIEVLREQDRQERLQRNAERDVEREQRYRERMAKVLGLGTEEQNKIGQLYTTLHSGRQRILEEMRVGSKTAEQADDEIDTLEDNTERGVRGILGEERMRKLRESQRAERQRDRGRDGRGNAQPAGAPGQPAQNQAPPAPPPT